MVNIAVFTGYISRGGNLEDKEQKQGKEGDSFQELQNECLLKTSICFIIQYSCGKINYFH